MVRRLISVLGGSALLVLGLGGVVVAQPSLARASNLPVVGEYAGVWSSYPSSSVLTTADRQFRSYAARTSNGWEVSVGLYASVDDSSPQETLDISGVGEPKVGTYRVNTPTSSLRVSVRFGLLNASTAGGGILRIRQIALGSSHGLQLAVTFALHTFDSDHFPVYGAWGVDTTQPLITPGDTALDRLGDFNGDNFTDVAVWRPSTGQWWIRGHAPVTYGERGDMPVPGDYNGDGITDLAVWRPSTGQWWIRGHAPITYGRRGDVPAQSDYNGDYATDFAVFRAGVTYIRGQRPVTLGKQGDTPEPGAYATTNNYPTIGGTQFDGRSLVAVYRPSTSLWLLDSLTGPVFGRPGDVAVPGEWPLPPNVYPPLGGTISIGIFRPAAGAWYLTAPLATVNAIYGRAADIPV